MYNSMNIDLLAIAVRKGAKRLDIDRGIHTSLGVKLIANEQNTCILIEINICHSVHPT